MLELLLQIFRPKQLELLAGHRKQMGRTFILFSATEVLIHTYVWWTMESLGRKVLPISFSSVEVMICFSSWCFPSFLSFAAIHTALIMILLRKNKLSHSYVVFFLFPAPVHRLCVHCGCSYSFFEWNSDGLGDISDNISTVEHFEFSEVYIYQIFM